jgi:predicted HicB family RNase H-like nuclease
LHFFTFSRYYLNVVNMPTDNTSTKRVQPDKEESVIAFRCPPELKKAVRVRAAEQDTSVQELCIRALRLLLGMAA